MANVNASILTMLKVYYKDGVENLMFRNSPVLKEIKKERVEGKSQNFSAMYGRGGAVGGDFTAAKDIASMTGSAVEFAVTPGQLFSVYSINAKEAQASQTNKGAYMKLAGAKMFAASESFRKTMALALYGRGYGELCAAIGTPNFVGGELEIEMPSHAIMAIDIGSRIDVKSNVADPTIHAKLEVKEINGNKVKITTSDTYQVEDGDVYCLKGSMDASGNPTLPMGLAGWLPTVAHRKGGTWTSYIGNSFFGVKRNAATDRLAGAFYDGSAAKAPGVGAGDEKKSVAVQKLLQKCRRQGSQADLIIMNDEDFLDFSAEIESTNTYFTQTSTRAKKEASVGISKIAASFSTNYIENIYDDPYCPKGIFYILDKEYIKLWSYTNAEKTDDGVAANNAGKPDVMEAGNGDVSNRPDQLIIDDYLNIQPGQATPQGPASDVSIMFYGSFVVTNPSVCGVGLFAGAKVIEEK